MAIDRRGLAEAIIEGRVVWCLHALERMLQRGISRSDVFCVLTEGEVLEEYEDDTPFPSALVMGWAGERPLHVVAALNEVDETAYVITAYEPDAGHFARGYRRRN